jgi:hypothetical protein
LHGWGVRSKGSLGCQQRPKTSPTSERSTPVFAGRQRFLGVKWGWGTLLLCLLHNLGNSLLV